MPWNMPWNEDRSRSPLLLVALVAALSFGSPAAATVQVYGPGSNASPVFFGLELPPIGGALDERGFSGFEFLMSGVDPAVNAFNANDMFLVQGNDTNPLQALGIDLGDRSALSGVAFDFAIEQNLVGGRNLTFSLKNALTQQTSVLCWGQNCAAGSVSAETINGEAPFDAYNGLLVQVRAQDVIGSSIAVRIDELTGVDAIAGDPFFDGTVTPSSTGTILAFDLGRQGQLLMADELEFVTREWALRGSVTLNRPDLALTDRTKVRLAIDLVRDPNLPSVVPEPSTALLAGLGLLGLAWGGRRAR
ncbi:MAG: PEP-CTERM sorting domain-containing protein [Myxococcota bacterium]